MVGAGGIDYSHADEQTLQSKSFSADDGTEPEHDEEALRVNEEGGWE